MINGDIAAAPYIRHKELRPGMYEEREVPEYDADDKDLAWLHNVNTKNGQNGSLFAAAVGLYHQVAQRITRTSSEAGAATPSAPVEVRLSLDTFEKAVNTLELMHFDAVKAWWEEQQSGPSTSAAPEIPKIPAMKRLLPRLVALEGLSRLVPDSKLALQLLEYWLRRRQQEGGPLLARLWFEQPWKLVAFAEFVVSDDEDFDEHLPFMAVEPRSAHGESRRGGNQRRRAISEEDALEALCGLRNELEVLRTLADQVRKREKLKRQLLLAWQQETQMRLQLGLPPTQPIPGVSRPRAGAGTSAAAAGAGAAGVSAAAGAGTSAAAARASAAQLQPVPTGLADVSRRLAKAAAAAAATASPAQGSHGRQTRTAAAAAAATFEATFAAKRGMLVPAPRAAASDKLQRLSAAPSAAEQQPAAAAAAAPPAGKVKAAGGGKGGSRGGARARLAGTKRSSRAAVAAAAADDAGNADDEMDVSREGPEAAAAAASPGTTVHAAAEEVQLDEVEEQVMQQPPKRRRRVARSLHPEQAPKQRKQLQPAKSRLSNDANSSSTSYSKPADACEAANSPGSNLQIVAAVA
ncbi:hypothetical protein COO60DRAFT_253980 [Scenedesmus sp. NREL 46B-D3]|nr:hypothetical protein COO60DRAFT_253980 [Scenedesmus sp. NREL 46B-D3]